MNSGATAALNTIDLGVSTFSVANNSATLTIYDDKGGLPGIALESIDFTTVNPLRSAKPVQSFSSVLHPLLLSGATYWLALSTNPHTGDSFISWDFNDQGVTGGIAIIGDLGPWIPILGTYGAFRINGSPASTVPEASCVLLMMAGCVPIGFAIARRRHK